MVALNKYFELAVDFDKDIVEHAAKLKLINKKWNLSMTNCIGYITARRLGIKFLTGDRQFKNLPDVEFVK